jgi:hypothetical protein
MKASIYTLNNGTEVAYQRGTSRVVTNKAGEILRHEVKEAGAWREARGYFKPRFIEMVKGMLK